MNSGQPVGGPQAITALEVARCSGTDVSIQRGEIHYRYNGRVYCAAEIARMFPEVFDAKQMSFNVIMGWGGLVGAPLLAGAALYIALRAGIQPGRAGGLLALMVLAVMYNANRIFLSPAAKARQDIERVNADGSMTRLS